MKKDDHKICIFRNLQLAEEQMSELSSGLSNVDDKVAALSGQLNQYTQEAAQVQPKFTIPNLIFSLIIYHYYF